MCTCCYEERWSLTFSLVFLCLSRNKFLWSQLVYLTTLWNSFSTECQYVYLNWVQDLWLLCSGVVPIPGSEHHVRVQAFQFSSKFTLILWSSEGSQGNDLMGVRHWSRYRCHDLGCPHNKNYNQGCPSISETLIV